MNELPAAYEALLRAAAVEQPVDLPEVNVARDYGIANRCPGGLLGCAAHALGRRRMGRGIVEPVDVVGRPAGEPGLQAGMRAQLGKHAGDAPRVVARPGEIANSEIVGFVFVLARMAPQIGQRGGAAQLVQGVPDRASGSRLLRQDIRGEHADLRQNGLTLSARIVQGGYVAELVAEDAGELRLVVEEGKKSPGYVDVAPRHRERIHHVRIDDRKRVVEVAAFGGARQKPADRTHIALELLVLEARPELAQHLGMRLAADRFFLGAADAAGKDLLAGGGVDGATAQPDPQEGRRGDGREERPPAPHGSITSSCSGWVASIIGPFRHESQPRTRTRRPSSEAISISARRNRRRCFGAMDTVKSLRQSGPKLRYPLPRTIAASSTVPSTSRKLPIWRRVSSGPRIR